MYKKHSFSKEVWKTSFIRTLGAGISLHKWITTCQQTEFTNHEKQTVSSDLIQKRKKIAKPTGFDYFFSLVDIRKTQEFWQDVL